MTTHRPITKGKLMPKSAHSRFDIDRRLQRCDPRDSQQLAQTWPEVERDFLAVQF